MKKLLLVVFLFACAPLLQAQQLDSMVNKFRKATDVEFYRIVRELVADSIACNIAGMEFNELMYLNLEKCNVEVNDEFKAYARKLDISKEGNYNVQLDYDDGNEVSRVFTKMDGPYVIELVVINSSPIQNTFIWILGDDLLIDSYKLFTNKGGK